MDVQLSASTWIDNDVLNLSDHQIKELQRIAGSDGFSGLLEPNLMQSRARGPLVITYIVHNKRRQMLLGVYRTMPWPQSHQFAQINQKDAAWSGEKLRLLRVLKSPFDPELQNSIQESTARMRRALRQLESMETISPQNALEAATCFAHYATLRKAFDVVERVDAEVEACRHG